MGDIWGPPRAHVEGEDDDPNVRQIKAIVRYEIDARAVYSTRMYFNSDPEDDKLITVAHLNAALRKANNDAMDRYIQLENRIVQLHQRLLKLEKPWWKRW